MARLTGALTWLCEPAPPSLPTPGAIASREPAPIASDEPGFPLWEAPPPIALVSGDQRRFGVTGCEYFADLCGPETCALGVESIIRIPIGGMLRFELPAGCQHFRWSLEWVSQSEHERWRGLWPDTAEIVGAGEASDGPVLELAAPQAGDWSMSLKTDCGGERGDFFRVVVGE